MDRLDREIADRMKIECDRLKKTSKPYDFVRLTSNHSIGLRLKELLEARNVTQRKLAEMIGDNCTEKNVSKWVRGTSSIPLDKLAIIAELLYTSVDFLVTGKVERYITPTYNAFENLPLIEAAKLFFIDIPHALPIELEMNGDKLQYTLDFNKFDDEDIRWILTDIAKRLQNLKDARLPKDSYHAMSRVIIGSYLDLGNSEETCNIYTTCMLFRMSDRKQLDFFEPIENNVIPSLLGKFWDSFGVH